MVRLAGFALIGIVGASACFEDRYRCDSDSDCDVGAAGRCESDGSCTAHDASCPTERRYAEHSGELANQCFDARFAIANPCAGGQPAALPEGCAADVCAALPACCEIGWSDACVQQAQLRCTLGCDTRIAVTASRLMTSEHWELSWTGTRWQAAQRADRDGLIAWVGPRPGEREPRLAGFNVGRTELVIGDVTIAEAPVADREYEAITSIDFDRDGRDTIAIAYLDTAHAVQIVKLDTGDTRDFATGVGVRLAWGDSNRDGFPDGVAGRNATYTLLDNTDTDTHVREVAATTSSTMGGMATAGAAPIRQFDWADLNGDGQLDLVAIGSQIRVHADEGALRDTPLLTLDCDPPVGFMACPPTQLVEDYAFAGAVVPSLTVPTIVAAVFSTVAGPRHIYQVSVEPGAVSTAPLADDCPTCDPIVAVIARDLDGDHQLDIVGLDSRLRIYTALSSTGFVLIQDPFPGRAAPFQTVLTSVTGAPTM